MGVRGAASGSDNFFNLVFQNFDVLAVPVASLAYPLYASIRAIETGSQDDHHQWLMYWVLYSIITLFELIISKLMVWFPFWPYLKLFFTCWLVIPYFNGAAHVYDNFVRPYFVTQQRSVNLWYVPSKSDVYSKPEDMLVAAERYIHDNGPEAFENMIHRANRQSTMSTRNYTSHDDNYKYDEDHRY